MTDVWADDRLGRRSDAMLLKSFMIGRAQERRDRGTQGALVIGLNASWGQGKSFLMTRLAQELRVDDHLVVEINAWKDDASDDPLVAVLAEMESELRPLLDVQPKARNIWSAIKKDGAKIAGEAAKAAATHFIRRKLGNAFDVAAEQLDESMRESLEGADINGAIDGAITSIIGDAIDARVAAYRNRLDSISSFRENYVRLSKVLHSSGKTKPPHFVFIDELDRCRPLYAIELLEQIKHIFDIDDTVFLIATDADQLEESIKAVYGSGFNSRVYLRRFFDRTYHVPNPKLDDFCNYLFEASGIDSGKFMDVYSHSPSQVFAAMCQSRGATPRDAYQIFDIVHSVATIWPHKTRIEIATLTFMAMLLHARDEMFCIRRTVAINTISFPYESGLEVSSRNGPGDFFTQPLSVVGLAQEVIRAAFGHDLHHLSLSYHGGGIESDFVKSVISEEAMSRFNYHVPDRGETSLIRTYVDLIHSAARIE